MKIWISKNSEVRVHEQLVAQLTLGILSGDLLPGERLPSTRELARRHGVHQNTVSSAYRRLAEHGLVEHRRGGGVYVAEKALWPRTRSLDDIFHNFLEEAVSRGFSRSEIQSYLRSFQAAKADSFIVVESDVALRDILVEEVRAESGVRTSGLSLDDLKPELLSSTVQLLALEDERPKVDPLLPSGRSCFFLRANSVSGSMLGEERPRESDLVAVVSGWPNFIAYAKLYLLAAKVEPEAIITRETSGKHWRKGLEQAGLIICDSLTASEFDRDRRLRVFPLVARASLLKLKETFI